MQIHQVLNPRGNRFATWDATVSAMQVGAAAFAAACITEGSIETRIAHEMRTVSATGPAGPSGEADGSDREVPP